MRPVNCRFEVALASAPTNFTLLSAGLPSTSGIGSDRLTTLSPSTNYVGRVTCVDAANNRGISTATASFATPAVSTANKFVDLGGSTTGACTSSGAPCTGTRALATAVPGDVIQYTGGTPASPKIYTTSAFWIRTPSGSKRPEWQTNYSQMRNRRSLFIAFERQ